MDKKITVFLCFLIIINIAFAGVPDDDKDGVPNQEDKCPDSKTTVVDRNGCTCLQKTSHNCTIGCCQYDENPCTDLCGESSGEAICNFWNIKNCPVEKLAIKTEEIKEEKQKEEIKEQESKKQTKEEEIIEDIEEETKEKENIQQQEQTEEDKKETVATGKAFEFFKKDEESIKPVEEKNKTKTILQTLLIIFAILIIILLFVYFSRKKKKDLSPLKNYLQINLNKGYSINTLKNQLSRQGWDKKIIDKVAEDILKKH